MSCTPPRSGGPGGVQGSSPKGVLGRSFGYAICMTDTRDTVVPETATAATGLGYPMEKADHAMGLELQIVELVEQQARARVQHRDEDAEQFESEIAQLRAELAAASELVLPPS
jgi:hypothetical protein